MSEPINHHYVSRCQSNNFFNTTSRKIFVLDKNTNIISEKRTTKTLFSDDDSNTRTDDDLALDRRLLEKDLKDNFEDHYQKHYKVIQESISNPENPPAEIKESLIALTKFGIIGELRHPMLKKGMDQQISHALFERILPQAAPKLKQELLELQHRLSQTKHSNSIIYSKHADLSFSLIGDIKCWIHKIGCNKFFLLPDTSAVRVREKINHYFNPDVKEIAIVGIPLSSKIFLHSQSIKLEDIGDKVIRINEGFPGGVEWINYGLYQGAFEQVACEDYDYLVRFRDNLSTIRQLCYPDEIVKQ